MAECEPGFRCIDSCLHQDWSSQGRIVDYLSRGWRDYIGKVGERAWGFGAKDISMDIAYHSPTNDDPAVNPLQAGARPDTKTELAYDLAKESLRQRGGDTAVLSYGRSMLVPADNNALLGRELCFALNKWTQDHWLSQADSPFYGSVLVPNQFPEDAAAEVRRWRDNPRMVQIAMGGNGLGKPFGHPIYDPIFRAAADCGMPIMIHCFADAAPESLPHPTAGGLPSFYSEFRALGAQVLMTHILSIISQGVFEKYRDLKVFLVGGGALWILPLLWRMEVNMNSFGREVPWLKRRPSEYFRDNVRVSTYHLEEPPDAQTMERLLRLVDGVERLFCFASGAPFADADDVATVQSRFPSAMHDQIFFQNARELYDMRIA